MKSREDLEPVIIQAIRSGYRLIDTAAGYGNEKVIGNILKKVFEDDSISVKREDMFITSKLSVFDSLKKLQLEYIDLYLIHWPGTFKKDPSDPINKKNRLDSYRALEKLHQEGKVKHIGISNYTTAHINELLSVCTVIPYVHQFELHPCLYQKDLIDLCNQHKIVVQAYSSLGEGKLINGDVRIRELEDISRRMNQSVALVLLRWAVQHNWLIIPKSRNPDRVRDNAKVMSIQISDEDMKLLDEIYKTHPHRFCWNPSGVV
ncbi:NADP-dependent oxidoreductase domain-containing protein [Pilobolus umbonatus]|nr:NADP-dependent oxidoreductase domain-containing protein [Pilobolus umbonatus]